MRALKLLVVLLWPLLAAPHTLRLSTFVDPVLARSPSGSWQLVVDPSSPWGRGPARYELGHDGVPVWSGDLTCTLRGMAVGDDGLMAGAAAEQPDGLHLMIVGPDGVVRFEEILPPEASMIDGPTYPLCTGVRILGESDEVHFRVLHHEHGVPEAKEWRRVQASTGASLGVGPASGVDWQVAGTAPIDVGRPQPLLPPVPLELDLLGAIELQATAPAPAQSWDFDFDDQGRIGRMVRLAEGATRFELRDGAGALVAAVTLPIADTPESSMPAAFWVQGGRWLVHTATYGEEGRARAWWLDLPAGTLIPVEPFVCAPIAEGDGTGDGGFVVLTSRSVPFGSEETLSSYDARGQLRWRDGEAHGNSKDGLLCPEDVCVSPRGEIGVLDNVRDDIQLFDLDGRFTGAIHLADALGRKPNYPSKLGVDAQGDWVVQDFHGTPAGLRISRDGRLLSAFTPHFADGRIVEMRGGLQVAPDGQLWTSDGFAGLRLDANGLVDLVAGMPPEASALGEVEATFLDARGRVALADHRTHAIHVFDATGTRVAVCVPAPDDLTESAEVAGIALTDAGQVHAWLGLFSFFGQLGVAFGQDGQRLGRDEVAGPSYFQPGKSSRWVAGLLDLQLVAGDGEVLRTISRSPDRRWLGTVRAAAVAPGGEVAVIARDRLHVFGADGAPVTSFELPDDADGASLAFDGSRVLLAWLGQLWEVDIASGRLRHARLPDVTPDVATRPAWGADGAEVRILDEKARRVLRYAIRP